MQKHTSIGLILVLLLALPVSPQSSSSALSIRWKSEVGSASETAKFNINYVGAEDINKDKLGEVIAVSSGSITSPSQPPTNIIYVFGRDGSLLWKRNIDDEITSTYVDDIDRDGYREILVSAGQVREEISRGKIYVFSDEGQVLRTLQSSSIINSMFITDLDGDKLKDIIGGSAQRVQVFDSYGLSKWNYATYSRVTAVAAADIEGDETEEVIAGSDKLFILDGLGGIVNTIDIADISEIKNDEISSIDLVNNSLYGYPLILVATAKGTKVVAFKTHYNTSEKTYQIDRVWERDFGERLVSHRVVDLTGEGNGELLVGTEDDYITALNGNGDVLWSFKANGDVTDESFADINSDGRGEVILGTVSGTIYVISKDKGEFMWRYDLNEPIGKVEVADLEGDPYKEVVVGTLTRMVYVFEVNQTFTDLQMAEDLYIKAQEFYIISEYNLSLEFLTQAKEFYMKANDPVGVRKTNELIKNIDEKFSGLKRYQADMYYNKAQEYFVEEDYLQAKQFAEMAKILYDEFRDTQNSLKAELLLMRINKMIGATVKETTTTFYVPPPPPKTDNTKLIAYGLLGLAFIILVVGLLIRRKRSAQKVEREMSEYEKELEKVIEGDLADLKDMKKGGG